MSDGDDEQIFREMRDCVDSILHEERFLFRPIFNMRESAADITDEVIYGLEADEIVALNSAVTEHGYSNFREVVDELIAANIQWRHAVHQHMGRFKSRDANWMAYRRRILLGEIEIDSPTTTAANPEGAR